MGAKFWIVRFAKIFLSILLVLGAVSVLKGREINEALAFNAFWSLISTGIFISTRLYRSRRGEHCALCQDIPLDSEERPRSSV